MMFHELLIGWGWERESEEFSLMSNFQLRNYGRRWVCLDMLTFRVTEPYFLAGSVVKNCQPSRRHGDHKFSP